MRYLGYSELPTSFVFQELLTVSPLTQQVLQGIEKLPAANQQQILDFVEFLMSKYQQSNEQSLSSDGNDTGVDSKSFAETARDIIGMGEGPGDLSTNPDYMEGYGQ